MKLKLYYKKLEPNQTGFIDTMYRVKTPNLLALCQALTNNHQPTLYIPEDKYNDLKKELNMPDEIVKEFDHITVYDDANYTFVSIRSEKYEDEDVKEMLERDKEQAKEHMKKKEVK